MSDRELLELAAKAAGIEVFFDDDGDCYRTKASGSRNYWNPIAFDGDALRLAVKLRIDLHTTPINGDAVLVTAKHRMRSDLLRLPNPTQSAELYQPDPYAATRRAIVRAAAEIGKGIQLQTAEGVLEDNYYKSQAEAEELGRQMQEGGAA